MGGRQKVAISTLATILINETTKSLGRDAGFLGPRLTIRRRNGVPNWDANIGIASTEVVSAYLKALWRVKSQFDLDDHPDPHPGPRAA